MSLKEIRDAIDAIDAEIVALLDRRAAAGREAGEVKKARSLPLRHPEREGEVLARLASLSDGSMPKKSLEKIYSVIMSETLAGEYDGARTAGDASAPCPDPSPKHDFAAEVAENVEVAPGFRRMRLSIPGLGGLFRPGQFFQLRIADGGLFLRRPFAPSAVWADGLTFVYAVVGEGTRCMARIPQGGGARVLAPLGNAFTLPEPGARALLVGGGCGAPSLATLAAALKARGAAVTVVVGARTAAVLLERHLFAGAADRLIIATDDGSAGCHGNVLDAYRLEERAGMGDFDRVYACGPTPMLRAAAKLAEEKGFLCEVSLEERMACGFGACMGCAVPVKDAEGGIVYRRVCHEGPVFDSRVLAWDAMR